jgi:hypothetical protein
VIETHINVGIVIQGSVPTWQELREVVHTATNILK